MSNVKVLATQDGRLSGQTKTTDYTDPHLTNVIKHMWPFDRTSSWDQISPWYADNCVCRQDQTCSPLSWPFTPEPRSRPLMVQSNTCQSCWPRQALAMVATKDLWLKVYYTNLLLFILQSLSTQDGLPECKLTFHHYTDAKCSSCRQEDEKDYNCRKTTKHFILPNPNENIQTSTIPSKSSAEKYFEGNSI